MGDAWQAGGAGSIGDDGSSSLSAGPTNDVGHAYAEGSEKDSILTPSSTARMNAGSP